MTATDPYPVGGIEQPRQPGGTPAGGQFATMSRREPDVSLANLSDDEYNADASFEYPPLPRSVEQHVAFWSRVKVPDAVCARVRAAYVERTEEWRADQLDAWDAANPGPTSGAFGMKTSTLQEHNAARAAFIAKTDAVRPSAIPAVLARPLIRAAQMVRYARWLETEGEYNQVLETAVDVGENEPWTVRMTLDYWHLDELPEVAFEDPGSYSGINLAVMNQRLTELVDLLEGAEDQQ